MRSVVEGLRSIGADFNFNPRTFGDLARVVYAPANEALRQAIELKRQGAVDYVVAGPVNALFADESGGILLTAGDRSRHRAVRMDGRLLRGFSGARREEPGVSVRGGRGGVEAGGRGEANEGGAVVYWKSGDERFCERRSRSSGDAGWSRCASGHGTGSTRIFGPADYRERSTSPWPACS